ncbi:MAG: DPP IV N-terminal domain-containing protein [Crocinitomicaceae bacterium]|nr:DPP IV N-terminal domain-containing protein [Crocinitomicaceae bacterium]
MKSSVNDKKPKALLTIKELNTALNSEFYVFYGMSWINGHEFMINDGKKFYVYDVETSTGQMIRQISEDAEISKMHPGSFNVAYTIDNNLSISTGKGKVYPITAHKDPNIVAGQAIARSEFGITQGLFWSPNGQVLAFYEKDETNVSDYPLLDNSTTPGTLKSIKYPMAGGGSEKARLGIYDIKSSKLNYITAIHGENNYLTNVSWTPDNKYVFVAEVNRDQDHMWLHVYDASNGKLVKTLFEETSKTWVEPEHPAFFPEEGSNNFVWVSERNGYNNLYYYSFEGELIKQLTDHDFVVKEIMEFKNKQVYYATTGDTPTESHVYSVSLKGKTKILTRAKGSHTVHISDDGKYFHDNFSSHTVANKDWIINGKGKIVSIKMESRDKLSDYTIGTAEISTIEAKDGSKLYTRLIKPSNFDPSKKYPVLVYVYGGPHAQLVTDSWLDGASLWMYWMAEQGYLVYTVDNRGSAERGVAFESQIHRQLGTVELEDQMSGVEYLKTLPYVDASRLAVHGWSFGGFMTTSLMLRHAGTFNAGVAGGPVTDWKYYEIMYGERYMDTPDQNPKGYEAASLMTHAANLEGDLLLIHGTVDPTVVMQHSLSLVNKFVSLGIQMDFFPYPMHEHNVRGKDRIHLMEKVLDYVIENNQ